MFTNAAVSALLSEPCLAPEGELSPLVRWSPQRRTPILVETGWTEGQTVGKREKKTVKMDTR